MIRLLALCALAALALARLLRLPAPVSRYVVEGPSMLPDYRPGERLLVSRIAYRATSPATGDVVVVRDPERAGRLLLKRIVAAHVDPRGVPRYDVRGDNEAESRDSRHFGLVARDAIVGRAWRKY